MCSYFQFKLYKIKRYYKLISDIFINLFNVCVHKYGTFNFQNVILASFIVILYYRKS